MPRLPELVRLEARRLELARHCDLQREILVLQCKQVERKTAWIHKAWQLRRLIAPVVGSLVALRFLRPKHRGSPLPAMTSKLLFGAQLARGALSLWHTFHPNRSRG